MDVGARDLVSGSGDMELVESVKLEISEPEPSPPASSAMTSAHSLPSPPQHPNDLTLESTTCDTAQLLSHPNDAPTHEVIAWLACLLCCWPVGLFAVVHANMSDRANCKRDAKQAEYLGALARKFAIGAAVAGCGVYTVIVIYLV